MPIHPNARQCQYTKLDGSRCGSPAMEAQPNCYFHLHLTRRDPCAYIPPVEDANSLVFAIMEIIRAIQHDNIDPRRANAMLYGLQLLQGALKNFTLGRPDQEDEKLDTKQVAELVLKDLLGDAYKPPVAETTVEGFCATQTMADQT
ncbi:MAG: hypothetical protein HYX26_02690 [Acidobacteriales bacterium]|nr:hypothetical protein [Terriglobales bacterium]